MNIIVYFEYIQPTIRIIHLVISNFIPFQPSVAFYIETSPLVYTANHDWFLYEMQGWADIG